MKRLITFLVIGFITILWSNFAESSCFNERKSNTNKIIKCKIEDNFKPLASVYFNADEPLDKCDSSEEIEVPVTIQEKDYDFRIILRYKDLHGLKKGIKVVWINRDGPNAPLSSLIPLEEVEGANVGYRAVDDFTLSTDHGKKDLTLACFMTTSKKELIQNLNKN